MASTGIGLFGALAPIGGALLLLGWALLLWAAIAPADLHEDGLSARERDAAGHLRR